jgi:hypothetical protein
VSAANKSKGSTTDWRLPVLMVVVLGSLAFMLTRSPFGQDLGYHQFADQRRFFGIANTWDVLSNLGFLVVGVAGVRVCWRSPQLPYGIGWRIFFIGVALVSVGSAYYHWAPSNQTLVWDRLPMTIGFMGLFVALLAEYVSIRVATWLLLPALIMGAASVGYWHWRDDLRWYYWVQLLPMLVVPVLMLLYRPRYSHQGLLLITLSGYVLAKVAEHNDASIFAFTNDIVSGHTVKHVLAALSCYAIVVMLKRRKPVVSY